MTSQRRWSHIFKNLFFVFGVVFTVPVEWFYNAIFGRIMILNNFLTLRWSWTSCEATWRGFRGARRSQLPARRWYLGGTIFWCISLFVLGGQKQGNLTRNFVCITCPVLKVQTVQVYLWEGDSDVRLLQEARLLLYRVHLQSKCLQVLTMKMFVHW